MKFVTPPELKMARQLDVRCVDCGAIKGVSCTGTRYGHMARWRDSGGMPELAPPPWRHDVWLVGPVQAEVSNWARATARHSPASVRELYGSYLKHDDSMIHALRGEVLGVIETLSGLWVYAGANVASSCLGLLKVVAPQPRDWSSSNEDMGLSIVLTQDDRYRLVGELVLGSGGEVMLVAQACNEASLDPGATSATA